MLLIWLIWWPGVTVLSLFLMRDFISLVVSPVTSRLAHVCRHVIAVTTVILLQFFVFLILNSMG